MGKEQHVTDRRRVGQQHDQAINADPLAGRRRHSVLQRTDVILVVMHRFRITAVLRRHLRAEAFGLIFGVIQL